MKKIGDLRFNDDVADEGSVSELSSSIDQVHDLADINTKTIHDAKIINGYASKLVLTDKHGYPDASTGLIVNSQSYNIFEYDAAENIEIWFEQSKLFGAYCFMAIYDDGIIDTEHYNKVRYKKTPQENTFPNIDSRLIVKKNQKILISVQTTIRIEMNYRSLTDERDLKQNVNLNSVNLNSVKDDIKEISNGDILTPFTKTTRITNKSGIVELTDLGGYPDAEKGTIVVQAPYVVYKIVADKNCRIYANETQFTFSKFLTIYDNNTIDSKNYHGIRYVTDHNVTPTFNTREFPTINNKLDIKSGETLLISYSKNSGSSFELMVETDGYELADKVKVPQKNVEGIQHDYKIRYVNGRTSYDAKAIEYFEIRQKLNDNRKYLQYDVVHSADDSINADNWRLGNIAVVYDTEFHDVEYYIVNGGAQEMAIHLKDRQDFSGGMSHGDERYTTFNMFIDGLMLSNFNDISSFTECNRISFIQNANVYDPDLNIKSLEEYKNLSDEIMARHGFEYIFGNESYTLAQNVKWLSAETLTESYLGMFSILSTDTEHNKDITKYVYSDSNYDIRPLSSSNTMYFDQATEVTEFGDNMKLRFDVKDVQAKVTRPILMMSTNGSNSHKLYNFAATREQQATTTIGEIWKSKIQYTIEVNGT